MVKKIDPISTSFLSLVGKRLEKALWDEIRKIEKEIAETKIDHIHQSMSRKKPYNVKPGI